MIARRGRSLCNASSFQQMLLILLSAVLLAFMTALIGLYLAISDSEPIERAAVQRLRRAHSATMHAMERAGSAVERAGRAVKNAVHTTKPLFSSSGSLSSDLQVASASSVVSGPGLNNGELLPPLGRGRVGIVIVAHDRTDTLARCLDSLFQQPDLDFFHLAVSLDHAPAFDKMEAVVQTFPRRYKIDVWKKPADPKQKVAVAKIAAHFRFALSQSFEVAKHEFTLLIENDLILAPDFLWYFRLAGSLLDRDASLWCISSWNDNGFRDIVSDEKKLFRTDYFPGLGWMIRNDTWSMLAPEWPNFPSTGWDHWLRHGVPSLRFRDCVAPEVPRSKHVDNKGTNVKAGSGIYKLLEKMAFSKLPHGELHDVSYLLRDRYEASLQKLLQDAQLAPSLESLRHAIPTPQYYKLPYVREEFSTVAKALQLYPGQPRGARRGIILSHHPVSHVPVALVDRRQASGILPESDLWSLDPTHVFMSGKPNQSCNQLCNEAALQCVDRQLEFGNQCELLKEHFRCENGCGHQVGMELPCYVHDRQRDTALQCLVSDEVRSAKRVHPSKLCIGLAAPALLACLAGSSLNFSAPHATISVTAPDPTKLGRRGMSGMSGNEFPKDQRQIQNLALPADQEVQIPAASVSADAAVVLLLHPGEGSPGFAEVPHMGSALTGSSPGWSEAAEQLVKRVQWDLGDEAVEFRSMSVAELCEADLNVVRFEFILGVDLVEEPPQECAAMMQEVLSRATSRMFITSSKARSTCSFWSSKTLLSGVGEEELSNTGFMGLQATLGGYQEAAKMRNDVVDLWHRRTAEEAVYAILVLIDSAVMGLPAMQAQRPEPTGETIGRAIDRCQDAFRNCFTQPRCLQSLACLSQCGLADQSCSYRCIVSYQSQAFTDFSLCALQKQNLLNSQIQRPPTPKAQPMETFRGQGMTHETAEQILVGHFDPRSNHRHSWLVAAGSNPAYEQFALQYQLWYKGSGRNTFWYHPTFLVEALDGAKIWRTRDYRVRRKETPGMWDFSVVDNGIISEERWHLLGADDNLEWCVLFYVGVARKAGLSYRGCLVLTPEGEMPGPEHAEAITAAIARADMKPWELEATSNPPVDPANPPPLIAPETQEPVPLMVAVPS